MSISRSTYYAVAQSNGLKRESEAALCSSIENVVAEWPAYGYWRRGIVVNHKRIARIRGSIVHAGLLFHIFSALYAFPR